MRDALWHDLCCSALLLVIVPLCEQQTFTSKLAVTKPAICFLLCPAQQLCQVRDAIWQDLCCSALMPATVRAAKSQTRHCSEKSSLSAISPRDALCHDLCYSALLLVIVPLCEQQTFTSKLAVKHACCQAVVCTAALISEGCTLP